MPKRKKPISRRWIRIANSTDALGGVLSAELMQKQPDKAIATARTQLASYPRNAGFHILLGQLLMEQRKDLAGAEAEFNKPSTWIRRTAMRWLSSAWCRTRVAPRIRRCRRLSRGRGSNPREIAFYLLAGGIYENKQDWDHAKQQYQKVLEIQPENPLASNNLAYVMLEQGGNVDVAFAMAQTARRQLPDNPNCADTLGWAFYHKHVYTSAIGLFKEAVKKEPENALFNYHLGLAYAKNGQAALARATTGPSGEAQTEFPGCGPTAKGSGRDQRVGSCLPRVPQDGASSVSTPAVLPASIRPLLRAWVRWRDPEPVFQEPAACREDSSAAPDRLLRPGEWRASVRVSICSAAPAG